jgi:hypothetical protein
MLSMTVTETHRRLEPVTADPFITGLEPTRSERTGEPPSSSGPTTRVPPSRRRSTP